NETKKFSLKEGTYTMIERQAPEGYEIAEAITFRVTAKGEVEVKEGNEWKAAAEAKVQMQDAKKPVEEVVKEVTFSKVEVNKTEELAGADLTVVEGESAEGQTVATDAKDGNKLEWKSGNETKKFSLKEGTYTMIERQAPDGYEIAEAITFRVTAKGEVEVKEGNEWKAAAEAKVQMQDAKSAEIKEDKKEDKKEDTKKDTKEDTKKDTKENTKKNLHKEQIKKQKVEKTNKASSSQKKQSSPKTGDTSNVLLYGIFVVISIFSIVQIVFRRKKA
ncbi:MAG TPA: SpaA isopeptide-forming pilin-related protein, partial [Lachnospiraceae bacterium]